MGYWTVEAVLFLGGVILCFLSVRAINSEDESSKLTANSKFEQKLMALSDHFVDAPTRKQVIKMRVWSTFIFGVAFIALAIIGLVTGK